MAQDAQDSASIKDELPGEEEQLEEEKAEVKIAEAVDEGLVEEHVEGGGEKEHVEGEGDKEHVDGEGDKEHVEGGGEREHVEGEGEKEHVEETEGETNLEEGEAEHEGEEQNGEEQNEEEELPKGEGQVETKEEEQPVEEEQEYVEPPVDPTAPLNITDSEEAKRPPHVIRPEQLAEVEKVWALYQNYNPAYTDLDNVISVKELVYMLKCLLLMTYTPEQMLELVEYVCQPPHPEGLITYEQFLRIVTIRWRDVPLENELRQALQTFDPLGTSQIDAEGIQEDTDNPRREATPAPG